MTDATFAELSKFIGELHSMGAVNVDVFGVHVSFAHADGFNLGMRTSGRPSFPQAPVTNTAPIAAWSPETHQQQLSRELDSKQNAADTEVARQARAERLQYGSGE